MKGRDRKKDAFQNSFVLDCFGLSEIFFYLTRRCQSKAPWKLSSWGGGEVSKRKDEIILLLLADAQPFDSQRWSLLSEPWQKGQCFFLRFTKLLTTLLCICYVFTGPGARAVSARAGPSRLWHLMPAPHCQGNPALGGTLTPSLRGKSSQGLLVGTNPQKLKSLAVTSLVASAPEPHH